MMIKITLSTRIVTLSLLLSLHFHLLEARFGPPLLLRRPHSTRAPKFQDERSKQVFAECSEHYRSSRIDHFSWANQDTYQQRYFICDKNYNPSRDGVIFFYCGNEADVTLYLNNTGLMHELASRHNALLVFAEHRYYGHSKPFPIETEHENMGYLTTEQAMADYASLLWDLKSELNDQNIPIVGFGGSYGGMLAAWFRVKYPHLMDGAIAASAPIWSFFGEDPPYDSGGFNAAVTWDASEEGGSAPACVPNARKAWQTMFEWGKSREGRRQIAKAMRLCPKTQEKEPFSSLNTLILGNETETSFKEKKTLFNKEEDVLTSEEDIEALAGWLEESWAYLAMGDYPYPSGYILNGEAVLPAYPVRVACQYLADKDLEGEALLSAMTDAVGVFYNATGAVDCFDFGSKSSAGNATEQDATFWDFQFCSEQFMPQTSSGAPRDMFWDSGKFDFQKESQRCQDTWGVRPSKYKASIEWGGKHIGETASNIVFSNGGRDPWRSGGVLDSLSDTLVAINIPEGAHHLDFMFSHDDDPESVIQARKVEEEHITRWIKEARERAVVVAVADGTASSSATGTKDDLRKSNEDVVLPRVDFEHSSGVSLSVA
jgi:lysosomal Pro-X carboxypeptidase